jgi:hypothetical protein
MQELVGYDGLILSQWDRTLDPKMLMYDIRYFKTSSQNNITRTLNIESKEHLIGAN